MTPSAAQARCLSRKTYFLIQPERLLRRDHHTENELIFLAGNAMSVLLGYSYRQLRQP